MDFYKQEEMKSKKDEEKSAVVITKNHEVNNNNEVETPSTGAKPKKKIQFNDNDINNEKKHKPDERDIKNLITGIEMGENFLRSLKPLHEKVLKQVSESEKARTPKKKSLDIDNAETKTELINLFKRGSPSRSSQQRSKCQVRPSTPPPHIEDSCYWNQEKRPRYEYDDDEDHDDDDDHDDGDDDAHLLIDILCEELAAISLE